MTGRETRVFNHLTNRLAIGLLFVMALSVPFSYWPRQSFESLNVFARQVLVLVLIVNAVENIEQIVRCLWIIILGVSCHAALIVKKFLAGDLFFGRVRGHESGLYGDPNDLALNLVMLLPILVFFLTRSSRWTGRVLWIALVGLYCAAIVATQSRGGLLGLAVVGTLILVGSRGKWLLGFAATAIAIVVLVGAPPGTFDRYATLGELHEDESVQGRLTIWKSGLRMYADHPILGVGARGV